MMRVSYVGLIIFYTIALTRSESPLGIEFITRCKSNSGCEILQTSESRYQTKEPRSGYAKRDDIKKQVDLPVNFRAPNYGAYNFWDYKEQQQNHRRTFFEDTFYYPQDRKNTYPRVPDFYQFVTSMFGIKGEATTRPENYHYNRNHATSPYPYTTLDSYYVRPTQPNYIPPPKPIRASVIKLETITRSPNLYHSFDYDTGKFYQNFGNILNPVIIQNSKNPQSLNFHDSSNKLTSNTGVSLPVLSKPLAAPPTTLKPPPEFSNFFSNQPSTGLSYSSEHSKSHNRTDYKYPDSVQDKLPPIDFSKIPYILTSFVPSVTTTLPSETLSATTYDGNFFSSTNAPPIPRSSIRLIDIRNPSQVNTAKRQQQSGTEIERIKNFDFDVTTFESLEKPVQKIREPQRNSIRKFNPSVEIITNLTVEGLSKGKNDNANIQNHVNYFNVRNLISYEMNKFKNNLEPDKFERKSFGNDSQAKNEEKLLSHLVNFNDELSLDAKILKDTNWDGFPTISPNLTIETHSTKFFRTQIKVETTTNSQSFQQFRFKPTFEPQMNETKAKEDFWESGFETGTTVSDVHVPTTTTTTTTTLEEKTEKLQLLTTTEIVPFSTVSETSETTEFTTNPEVLTTQEENLRLVKSKENLEQQTTTELLNKTTTTEMPTSKEISKTSPSPESTTPYFKKRKYSRRAKFLNYTPYTTSKTIITTELPKKVFNRNNFPRRQKPNITLAFGNKNIIKTVETNVRDEVMKFSDEDLSKRKRKPGKRRRSYKRRNSTLEPTVSE